MKHLITVEYKVETLDKKSCFFTGIVETEVEVSDDPDMYQKLGQSLRNALELHSSQIPTP